MLVSHRCSGQAAQRSELEIEVCPLLTPGFLIPLIPDS